MRNLRIGISATATSYNGSIDNVRIYNRVLSADEVKALYQERSDNQNNGSLSTAFCIKDCINETGLVAQWMLDGDGNDYYNNYNATTIIATNVSNCRYGDCMSFAGENDRVVMPDSTYITNTSYSLIAWIKLDDSGSTARMIMSQDKNAGPRNYQWAVKDGLLKMVRFNLTSGVISFIGTHIVGDGVWHNVAFTFDSSVGSVMYVDGVIDTISTNTDLNNAGSLELAIGNRYGTTYVDEFVGLIDNVFVYNRSLSAKEIYNLYLSGYAHHIENATLQNVDFDGGTLTGYTWNNTGVNYTANYDYFFQNWTNYYSNQTSPTYTTYTSGQAINYQDDYGILTLTNGFTYFNMTFADYLLPSNNISLEINDTLLISGKSTNITGSVVMLGYNLINVTLQIYQPNSSLYNITYNDIYPANNLIITNLYDYDGLVSIENGTWTANLTLTGDYNYSTISQFQVGYGCIIFDTWTYSSGSLVCNVLSVLKNFKMYDFNITMHRTEISKNITVYLERSNLRK